MNPTQDQSLNNPLSDLKSPLPEILAPAGGRNQFMAALNSGADAVYLGMKEFNARGRAENFSIEDLEELVPLANRQNMKVLVTLNILLKDIELPQLIERLSRLVWVGVHAVIVQDLGVARVVRDNFPELRLHASTQLAVHNLQGVKEAARLGFKRIVVARELTVQELTRIKKELSGTGIEIEAFCHGSLCYSYSGLCFFSGAEDARSGNRGECAYTCRKPYKILNEPGHGFLFSMKDLDTHEDLEKFVKAGIDTLKIEGRKKDAQYVASVVGLYRKKMNDIAGRETHPRGQSSNRDHSKDMVFSFHRDRSTFFTLGRYHENVIDLNNPTHKGLFLGKVESIKGRKIKLRSKDGIEKYDGIRIEQAEAVYHAKPQHGQDLKSGMSRAKKRYDNGEIQFSVRDMFVKGKAVAKTRPYSIVELLVPSEFNLPQVGDSVYKSRSNELKRYTDSLLNAPKEEKLRALRNLKLEFSIDDDSDQKSIKLEAKLGQRIVHSKNFPFSGDRPRNKSSLQQDLVQTFSILGDLGFACEIEFAEGDWDYFVSRKEVKQWKKVFGEDLQDSYISFNQDRVSKVRESLWETSKPLSHASQCQYSIKIDRLEYLSTLEDMKLKALGVTEIVFEPKRAFLGKVSPQEIFQTVFQSVGKMGLRLRFAIPMIIRAWDEPLLKKWIKEYVSQGGNAFELANIGGVQILRDQGIDLDSVDISSDFSFYLLNTQAALELNNLGVNKPTLSIEDDSQSIIEKLKNWPDQVPSPQVILYKDTPLFVAEACSLTALHHGCPGSSVCGYRSLEIENDEGERFHVAHEACKSVVFGEQAFSWTHHKHQLMEWGVSKFRLDFLTRVYDAEDLKRIILGGIHGDKTPGTHEANFSRTLL